LFDKVTNKSELITKSNKSNCVQTDMKMEHIEDLISYKYKITEAEYQESKEVKKKMQEIVELRREQDNLKSELKLSKSKHEDY